MEPSPPFVSRSSRPPLAQVADEIGDLQVAERLSLSTITNVKEGIRANPTPGCVLGRHA
jgi:hypothetical protein